METDQGTKREHVDKVISQCFESDSDAYQLYSFMDLNTNDFIYDDCNSKRLEKWIQGNRAELIDSLIKMGYQITTNYASLCVELGNTELLKVLLEAGFEFDSSLLTRCIELGKYLILKQLFEHGITLGPNAKDLVRKSLKYKMFKITALLIERSIEEKIDSSTGIGSQEILEFKNDLAKEYVTLDQLQSLVRRDQLDLFVKKSQLESFVKKDQLENTINEITQSYPKSNPLEDHLRMKPIMDSFYHQLSSELSAQLNNQLSELKYEIMNELIANMSQVERTNLDQGNGTKELDENW